MTVAPWYGGAGSTVVVPRSWVMPRIVVWNWSAAASELQARTSPVKRCNFVSKVHRNQLSRRVLMSCLYAPTLMHHRQRGRRNRTPHQRRSWKGLLGFTPASTRVECRIPAKCQAVVRNGRATYTQPGCSRTSPRRARGAPASQSQVVQPWPGGHDVPVTVA